MLLIECVKRRWIRVAIFTAYHYWRLPIEQNLIALALACLLLDLLISYAYRRLWWVAECLYRAVLLDCIRTAYEIDWTRSIRRLHACDFTLAYRNSEWRDWYARRGAMRTEEDPRMTNALAIVTDSDKDIMFSLTRDEMEIGQSWYCLPGTRAVFTYTCHRCHVKLLFLDPYCVHIEPRRYHRECAEGILSQFVGSRLMLIYHIGLPGYILLMLRSYMSALCRGVLPLRWQQKTHETSWSISQNGRWIETRVDHEQ